MDSVVLLLLSSCLHYRVSAQLPKILCLHGGGQSASAFASDSSVQALQSSLQNSYEFVFAQSPEDGNVWIRDPPSKSDPTTDPAWADTSVEYLDNLTTTEGPFAGILGYSQGSAFSTYYVARKQTAQQQPFYFAMLFCGYLPTTHIGLVNLINRTSPFYNISAMVFMGEWDWIITNSMTEDQADKYTNPTVITSSEAGHNLPVSSDSTFTDVVNFAIAQLANINETNATTVEPTTSSSSDSSSPTPSSGMTPTAPTMD